MLAVTTNETASLAAFSRNRLRNDMVRWLSDQGCSHALTLVANRSLTVGNLARMFGEFCLDLDRLCLGRKNVGNRPLSDRLFAVAFVEHPDTNIHLHVALRLDGWWQDQPPLPMERHIEVLWKRVTGGAGNTLLRQIDDDGWGYYITKEADLLAGDFFMSSDYHPRH